MIAPAFMITIKAAAKGAPIIKKIIPTAISDKMKNNKACIGHMRVIAAAVAATAIIADI